MEPPGCLPSEKGGDVRCKEFYEEHPSQILDSQRKAARANAQMTRQATMTGSDELGYNESKLKP